MMIDVLLLCLQKNKQEKRDSEEKATKEFN